jgi:Tat protein translocase TatB subunit
LGLFEIIIILAVALIVLGPERMPEVIRAAVQIIREVRTAANEAMREITEAIDLENPPPQKNQDPNPALPLDQEHKPPLAPLEQEQTPAPPIDYQPVPPADKEQN